MQDSKFDNSRTCILVIGMHRSGTSTMSGCLSMLGYELGKNVVPPNRYNPKGYFENKSIYPFNDRLLGALNARWHDTMNLPDNWVKDEIIMEYQYKLINILSAEFHDKSDFIIKDPRISILLPFYLGVFEELNVKAKIVICSRDPIEVAASLAKRNNLSYSKSLLLWANSNLNAEHTSRNVPRIFIRYENILNKPVDTIRSVIKTLKLDIEFSSEIQNEIMSFVEPDLKHHSKEEPDMPAELPNVIINLNTLLIDMNCGIGSNVEIKMFDSIRNQCYSSFDFYNGIDNNFNILLWTIYKGDITRHKTTSSPGLNKVSFIVDGSMPVSELIFYPANHRIAIKLIDMYIVLINGDKKRVEISETNAELNSGDGVMVFESDFPMLKYRLDKPSEISEVFFEFQFLAHSSNTYRLSVEKRNSIELELRDTIQKLNSDKKKLIETIVGEESLDTVNPVTNYDKLEMALRDKDELIHQQEKMLDELKRKEKELRIVIRSRNDLLDQLIGSQSWRVTKPLRFIKSLVVERK